MAANAIMKNFYHISHMWELWFRTAKVTFKIIKGQLSSNFTYTQAISSVSTGMANYAKMGVVSDMLLISYLATIC